MREMNSHFYKRQLLHNRRGRIEEGWGGGVLCGWVGKMMNDMQQ